MTPYQPANPNAWTPGRQLMRCVFKVFFHARRAWRSNGLYSPIFRCYSDGTMLVCPSRNDIGAWIKRQAKLSRANATT